MIEEVVKVDFNICHQRVSDNNQKPGYNYLILKLSNVFLFVLKF